jgi:hypothetical protein
MPERIGSARKGGPDWSLNDATTVAATSIAAAVAEERSVVEAWTTTQERLPDGWTLDSLRCASTGLEHGRRSEDWVAVAVGPSAEERTYQDADAFSALGGLVESFDRQ